MYSPATIYPSTEKLYMSTNLKLAEESSARRRLRASHPAGGDVDKTVDALVDGTKLADPAVRKALVDGGEAAVAASTDPMIVAARRVDPIVREPLAA